MVFYSFYKILKDMIGTLFGKKCIKWIIFIVICIIILLFLDKSHVFASFDFSYNDVNYSLPELPSGVEDKYFVINKYTSSQYTVCQLYVFDTEQNFRKQTVGNSIYYWVPYGVTFQLYGYNSGNNQTTWGNPQTLTAGNYYISSSDYQLIYSNYDLYTTSNVLFFEKTTPTVIAPEILNSTNELSTLEFDVLRINAHDYSLDNLWLLCYDKNFQNTESFKNLYPVKEILLNQNTKYFVPQRTTNNEIAAIYWVELPELGLNWVLGNTYGFRFAIRVESSSEFSDWEYEYVSPEYDFTVSTSLSQGIIDDFNAQTKQSEDEKRHEETVNSIDNINNFLNAEPNENSDDEIDGLMGITSDNQQLKDINTSFFSRFTSFLTNFLDYDYLEDEVLEIPLPHSDYNIVIHSNILSSHLTTTMSTIIGMLWMYIFTLYGIKFTNNLLITIQEGDLIDPNKSLVGAVKGEVILSNML